MSAQPSVAPRAGSGVGSTLAVGVQLALALALIHVYDLEGEGLRDVFAVSIVGWGVQLALPARWRLRWFLAVAAAALVAALGAVDAAWVCLTGAALVGLCLLPGSRFLRLAAVLTAASGLALLRAGVAEAPWSLQAWPVLASLFLFRAISFLYDRHHEKQPPPADLAAAYFFLPPNACFPVFPVVDFAALRRGYDPESGADVHQEGVERIVRGLIQLLFYRLVYQLAVLPMDEVHDAWSAVRYLVTNVLLIVRIMGMFHVSIGVLHLFGFRLPPTTQLPFLAPGFSEFWRRANVYWRDFVVKVFFYPAYFQLKAMGRLPAMAAATLLTFAAAWFLHSYQWFWFQGTFPLRWQDAAYWSVFGLLVTLNGQWVGIRGATRRRSARPASPAAELARALRIAGVFATFCVLWSIWMAPGLTEWLDLWRALAGDGLQALLPVAATLGTVALLGLLWPDPSPPARGYLAGRAASREVGQLWRRPPLATAAMASLLVLAVPGLAERSSPMAHAVWAMSQSGPNVYDSDRRTDAYYQELAELPRFDTANWDRDAGKPPDWQDWSDAGLRYKVHDARRYIFRPNISAPFKRKTVTTNSFGMRDREYALEKPPGVVRILVLGASTVAGSGVDDGEPFEAVAEERLNEDRAARGLPPVEILNLATPGTRMVRNLSHLEHALSFDPDWVVVAAEKHAWRRSYKDLVSAALGRTPIELPALAEVVEQCRPEEEAEGPGARRANKPLWVRCIQSHGAEVIEVVARRMAELAREHGFRLVWLELPTLDASKLHEDAPYRGLLSRLGFFHVDASHAFDGLSGKSLRVAPWDGHPNARAHRLIAARLLEELGPMLEGEPAARADVAAGGGS